MNNIHNRESERGFTLVELSIVLVIIGLLIGGVLKGQELIESSRLNSVATQYNSFLAATNTFNDRYQALPGDMAAANTRVPNCTAGNSCADIAGNGNGVIGAVVAGGAAVAANTENRTFWQQLSKANLVTGVAEAGDTFGARYPSARTGGGWQVVNSAVNGTTSHWFRLAQGATAVAAVGGDGAAALSPNQAATLDRKMDDGIPQSGTMQTIAGTDCNGAAYVEATTNRNCNVFFRMQ